MAGLVPAASSAAGHVRGGCLTMRITIMQHVPCTTMAVHVTDNAGDIARQALLRPDKWRLAHLRLGSWKCRRFLQDQGEGDAGARARGNPRQLPSSARSAMAWQLWYYIKQIKRSKSVPWLTSGRPGAWTALPAPHPRWACPPAAETYRFGVKKRLRLHAGRGAPPVDSKFGVTREREASPDQDVALCCPNISSSCYTMHRQGGCSQLWRRGVTRRRSPSPKS